MIFQFPLLKREIHLFICLLLFNFYSYYFTQTIAQPLIKKWFYIHPL